MIYDVIIIGSGPAGMAASLFLKRAELNILIIEKRAPGGKLLTNAQIENYLGFKNSPGIDLVSIMYKQMKDLHVQYLFTEALDICKVDLANDDSDFFVETGKGRYYAHKVIFAGGSVPKSLGLPDENNYIGRGISYCAICDGNFHQGKDVTVIGGSRASFQESLYLAKICKSVNLIVRNPKLVADSILIEKARETVNIKLFSNTELVSFKGNNFLDGIIIKDNENDKLIELKTDALFICIGWTPSTRVLAKYNILNPKGYIIVNEELETAIPGLYAAGDCIQKHLRQIITAVSDGAVCASSIIRKLS